MSFEIGQYVYTSKLIPGWFDYSMSHSIPENSQCVVMEKIGNSFRVQFINKNKEFGERVLSEFELKSSL
jgi:hypothetical protein